MDTLVHDPFWTCYPRFFGDDLKDLLAKKDPDAWPRFERGEIGEEEYFRTAFLDGRPIDGAGLRRTLVEGYELIEGIEALLDELKARGVEMHLFSNYPVWYRLLEEKLQLTRWAPWTLVSTHTGVRKPDAAAYTGAAERLGRAPEDLLFVDDRARNTEPARALGFGVILFESADQLRRELVVRGVL